MKAIYTLLILLIPFFSIGQDCSELFFSEHVEGSSQNKALEIFNPTNSSVNLSDYTIERYANGSNFVTDDMNLEGMLLPGQTWVVVHPDTNTTSQFGYIQMELYNLANQIAPFYPSPIAGMNGNDAITLSKNGTIIDIIGKIGEDPGDAWTDDATAGFTDANGGAWWTRNHTMIRKSNITQGVTSNPLLFNPSAQWDTLSINDWSNLGYHECYCSTIYGCVDSLACNFDENAAIDDGSCTYPSTSEVFIESCENIEWNGMLLEETGLYSYVTTNSNGCDSTISLDFTLLNSNFSIDNISSCESYVFNDEEYTESGMYTFEGTNSNGCDSTVIIDLTIFESIDENIIYGNPEPDPFSVSLYSASNNENNLIWSVEGGNIIENNGNSINIQWGNQGIGLITLVESNICNDFTNVFTVNIGGQIEPTWDCNDNFACIEQSDGSGNYQSLEECEANCSSVEPTWDCNDNFACIEQSDGSGNFQSLEECEANCSLVEPTWDCNDNFACIEQSDGSGNFQSLEECEANCSLVEPTWDCNANFACIEQSDGSGNFQSLEECEANCSLVEPTWDCNANFACIEQSDGSGNFQSLEECEANCSIIIEDSWNCVNDACVDPMDGTGIYDSLEECEANCSATSINETLINVNIYPNPSSNIFNLEFNSDSETEILVTNILGEQVYFESTKSNGEFNTQIDLSNYSKGIYNLTIKTSYGISNHKLILQ